MLFVAMMMASTVATATAPSVAAWTVPCSGVYVNKFQGNAKSAPGLIGVYSEIQYVDKGLCFQASSPYVPSWSLSWVSLEGPQTDAVPGIDIFQGGYAKCPFPAVGSCPWNNGSSYYWVYYAHEQGACGAAFNTGFINIAFAATGTHFFQVSKVGSQYNFYVDELLRYHRSLADIQTCWPGVTRVEWQNEMLNDGDQGGGPLSDHQDFGANQYQNATGWHPENRSLSTACDYNSYPLHWHCNTTPTTANQFKSWDDRAP
jgi:hypothetical protein